VFLFHIRSLSADGISSIDVESDYGKEINVEAVDVLQKAQKI